MVSEYGLFIFYLVQSKNENIDSVISSKFSNLLRKFAHDIGLNKWSFNDWSF